MDPVGCAVCKSEYVGYDPKIVIDVPCGPTGPVLPIAPLAPLPRTTTILFTISLLSPH